MKYKVVAAIDSMDTNPDVYIFDDHDEAGDKDVYIFDDHDEAGDFIYEEVHRRLLNQIDSSDSITEEELDHMREVEMSLFTFSRIDDD